MEEKNKDKSFQQRREELLKSRLITDNSNQSSQYLESLIEDVVLNGVSFNKQLPFLLSFAAREGLDAEQVKNDFVVLLGMLHPISKQPSKSEKMAILYQAQICHISEEVIQHILSELQEKKKKEQEAAKKKAEAEKKAREKAETERKVMEAAKKKAEAEKRAREKAEAEKKAREKDEAEKRAREKAEAEKKAREKAEAERRAREQEAALPPAIRNLISNMVYVEGGTFTMGATSEQGGDGDPDLKPAHRVTLSSFSICRYEVTQEEWEAVMGCNPSHFEGKKRPVESVSWNDCQEFIRKLNAITGKHFRLPTEAEWEFAARGGNKSKGYKYSGSNNIGGVAWYGDNSDWETHPVGQKSPNELGLYDMSGNVWEWCGDWWDIYKLSSQTDPKGPSTGDRRVFRGGGYAYADSCCVSARDAYLPHMTSADLGFRLAL